CKLDEHQMNLLAAGKARLAQRNPAVLLPSLRAAYLLTRERLQVVDEVRQEVVDDDARDDVVRVDRADSERELELLVDLLGHGAFAVCRSEGTERDVGRFLGVRESFVL